LCPTYFHWTSSTQPPWIIDGRGRAQRCFYVGALSQRRFYARSHRDVFTCACSHRYTFTWALPYRWLHACSLTDAYLRALAGSLLCTFTKCDARAHSALGDLWQRSGAASPCRRPCMAGAAQAELREGGGGPESPSANPKASGLSLGKRCSTPGQRFERVGGTRRMC
jgi:hypothetical protein